VLPSPGSLPFPYTTLFRSRVSGLDGPDDRRVIRRGRRVGAVIDDLEAGLLDVLARASQGAMRVLGVSTDQGNRAQFRILCGSELEKGLGKFFGRFWPGRHNLKIVRVVKLLVISEPKERHKHQDALDDYRHGRG